jgi:hypothetical protein
MVGALRSLDFEDRRGTTLAAGKGLWAAIGVENVRRQVLSLCHSSSSQHSLSRSGRGETPSFYGPWRLKLMTANGVKTAKKLSLGHLGRLPESSWTYQPWLARGPEVEFVNAW